MSNEGGDKERGGKEEQQKEKEGDTRPLFTFLLLFGDCPGRLWSPFAVCRERAGGVPAWWGANEQIKQANMHEQVNIMNAS